MKMERLDTGNHSWKIVSFYTKGTGYGDYAKRLAKSLLPLNVPFEIHEVPNRRDWNKNCHYKAIFMKQMLLENPGTDLIWVDADAIFHQYPELFGQLDCDFAAHFRIWIHNPNELLSGTLFIANTDIMLNIVEEWIVMNRKQPGNWDQKNLQRVIRSNRFLIKVFNLPIEYCCIFDDQNRKRIDPVIEHFQASRKLRRAVR